MPSTRLFPHERWTPQLNSLTERYQKASPYPHIVLDSFLEEAVAKEAMNEFPKPRETSWIQYKHFNENKLGKSKWQEFPPLLGRLADELNSPEFLGFLSKLTGISGLLADPLLEGGGLHQSETNGFLNIHADFTMSHYYPWRRRINLILYLNEGWKEEWNGSLELWDKNMKRCEEKVLPILNRALIFNTDQRSHHGFPDRLKCPPDVTRKSLALYYYTPLESHHVKVRSTNYHARPGETLKIPLIWLDKMAIHFYSLLKIRFGLSDDFASRILGFFNRKK